MPHFSSSTPAPSFAAIPSPSGPAELWPLGLRCEGRIAPAGVDAPHPALSWELAATPGARGRRQSAYHLLVASSPASLTPTLADRWDSGVVESSACTAILYAGRPLRSLERCHWAVRVRDERGNWSDWERSGEWAVGLLDSAREWHAEWIHAPEEPPRGAGLQAPDPWFRHEFHLDTVPQRAVALVASIGFHELYVNGRKIGDEVLAPNVYDASHRAAYVMREIASHLRPGPNVIGLWLGTGWAVFPHFQRNDRPARPLIAAQFHLEFGECDQRIVTDASWLVRSSPNSLIGHWNFQHFGGESYDARHEHDDWAQPGAAADGWRRAVPCALRLPLGADLAEPNRRQEELRPVAIAEPSPGTYRVDFGRNFAGFVEVALAGTPGTRIALEFSEREHDSVSHRIRSDYVIGPSGRGTFRNRFNYAIGRWLTLRGLAEPPDLGGLRAWCVRNDYASAAVFASSSERLNAILRTTRWTFENLTIGGFIADCPHRERMGYGGDGHASVTTGLYHYRLEAFLSKWNRDWHDVQGHTPMWSSTEDPTAIEPTPSGHPGEMPYAAPTYWGGGGPAWSGLCVHLPWQLYRFYGDRRVLARSLPVITRWLDFLETKVSGGLLRRWGGKWDFLGDWLAPDWTGVNSDTAETLFFNNCYWAWSLATAAKIARAVGEQERATQWETTADRARRAIHAAFYEPGAASYGDGSQVSLATALLAGIPPAALRPGVEQRLEHEIRHVRQGHIHAGITGGALLFLHLLEQDRHDLIHLMVNQSAYPSWAYMLERGATTLWETWDQPTENMSSLHSSFLYVGAWPLAGVLGISPLSETPGFERVRIFPGPIDAPDLTWARGHYDSVRGRIRVAWRIAEGEFTLELDLPPGLEAEIALPTTSPSSLTEGDRPLDEVPGLLVLRQEGSRTFVQAPSGTYRFRCPLEGASQARPAEPVPGAADSL